ncbi:MAG: DUF2330 domain-containing protein [Deltaproteobacteria bacterium]
MVRLAVPLALLALVTSPRARAFCGFYVAKADSTLYNHASQVVIARDGEREVLTLSNDFKGDLADFALVVPVPVVLTREQIHIGDRRLVERIDAYSAPRLVEYHDPDPCAPILPMAMSKRSLAMPGGAPHGASAESLGVKIEARYTVGEYDILILSATQSSGLARWLTDQGYRLPPKAAAALEPYLKQDMKFFVAKVNLKAQAKGGFSYLRPLQMAFESRKFMLPIRLGMANADGPQDLMVYTLTRKGRVELANYRTVELPTGDELPIFVREDFKHFYRSLFERAYAEADRRVGFLEYAWDSAWCDPCADPPLSPKELRGLGVFWLDEAQAAPPQPWWRNRLGGGGSDTVVTRLHVRYDDAHFPEDLVFQETGNRDSYQARYVLRYPWRGRADECQAGRDYLKALGGRHRAEANALAQLTGWKLETIYEKMGEDAPGQGPAAEPWYEKLWKTDGG